MRYSIIRQNNKRKLCITCAFKRGNKLFAVPGPLARRGKGGLPADGKKFVAEQYI